MGTSQKRDLYFEKVVKKAPTVTDYMMCLATSPFKTHRRMAEALFPMYQKLIEDKEKAQKQEDINEFAKTLQL